MASALLCIVSSTLGIGRWFIVSLTKCVCVCVCVCCSGDQCPACLRVSSSLTLCAQWYRPPGYPHGVCVCVCVPPDKVYTCF